MGTAHSRVHGIGFGDYWGPLEDMGVYFGFGSAWFGLILFMLISCLFCHSCTERRGLVALGSFLISVDIIYLPVYSYDGWLAFSGLGIFFLENILDYEHFLIDLLDIRL